MTTTLVAFSVAASSLRPHRAHDRSRYDKDRLADLVLQIATQGLLPQHPIIVAPLPDDEWEIISGHRRVFARILGQKLPADAELDAEMVQTYVATLTRRWDVLTDTALQTLAAEITAETEDFTIPVVQFDGSYKQAVLLVQSSNAGREEPDMLGLAQSLLEGTRAGISPAEAARNIGQTRFQVNSLIALARMAEEFADLAGQIADGSLPLSVAPLLMAVDNPTKRTVAARFVRRASGGLRMTDLRRAINRMTDFASFQLPAIVDSPLRRNVARAFGRFWQAQLKMDAESAWAVLLYMAYEDRSFEPWQDREALTAWLEAFGYPASGNQWMSVMQVHLTDVTCETCPIHQLPAEPLNDDMVRPIYPCRTPHRAKVHNCLLGLAPGDPFQAQVPPTWASHPGIDPNAGRPIAHSFADLQTAWQQQAEQEAAAKVVASEPAPAVAPPKPKPAPQPATRSKKGKPQPADVESAAPVVAEASVPAAGVQLAEPTDSVPEAPPVAPHAEVPSAAPTTVAAPTPEPAPQPAEEESDPVSLKQARLLEEQRALIAAFQQQVAESGEPTTLLAADCSRCIHRRSDASGQQVIGCAWDDQLRDVRFSRAVTGRGAAIHVCWQYQPERTLRELLPDEAVPANLSRAWLTRQCRTIVDDAHTAQIPIGLFLTGRPMAFLEGNVWLAERFEQEHSQLTDGQLYALFVTLLTDIDRIAAQRRDEQFIMPGNPAVFATETWWRGDNDATD